MTTNNLFVIANAKQLRIGGSFRILLPFSRTSWCVGALNSAIFNNFHNRVEFGTILEGLRNFGRGGSTISVEDREQRERGSGGGSSLVRGYGGSCNLVQEISFHIVKLS